MKSLVIVDLQKDFYDPSGSLYVSGAEALPARVAAIAADFDCVFLTLDWHPANHCSFVANGGTWPAHCLQYSWGASLPDEVLGVLDRDRQDVFFYEKGTHAYREEYGAFNDISETELKALKGSEQIVVCGLCGDYCVGQTIKRLAELGLADKVAVDLSCTGSIDDGSALKAIIDELNLQTI